MSTIVYSALRDAHDECIRLNLDSDVMSAIQVVQSLQHDIAEDVFAKQYINMTNRISAAVIAESDVDRSFMIYDVMLTLLMKTKDAFNTLYPGQTFAQNNELYFK